MTQEMLAIIAPKYTEPAKYELQHVPIPDDLIGDEVLVEVHAASINPIDVKKASGALKMAIKDEFPYKIGYDASGVVKEIGTNARKFKVGDEVFVRLPETSRGSWAEYVKCPERFIAHKPKSLSHEDAASLPLAAMTSLQALRKYKGSLEGKTVFVPAGLSGTGAYACQLAKNVFHAGKVITTVSTAKIPKIPELLGEGVVDQIIDYTKQSPLNAIPPASVDFLFDTTGQAMQFLSLMVPSTSTIISISTLPSGTQLQAWGAVGRPKEPQMPWLPYLLLNLLDSISKWRAWRWAVEYSYMFLDANGQDLAEIARLVDGKKLRPVVGSHADLKGIEKVRAVAGMVYSGKGGLGKAVIRVR